MDAREELARLIEATDSLPHRPCFETLAGIERDAYFEDADAILAAGYRKMPDREAIYNALMTATRGLPTASEMMTDAILALIEGNK